MEPPLALELNYSNPRSAVAGTARIEAADGKWVEWFFIFQMVCQLALLVPGMGAARVAVRVAAFGTSLVYLMVFLPRFRTHPASWGALGVLLIMGISLFHPLTNTLTAGLAQAALYVAILAPLWWVAGMRIDAGRLRKLVLLLWGFHACSALMGVLQMTFPGSLTPEISAVVKDKGDWYVEDMKITLANGARVFRPMGLTDYPGGAANSGFYVVLLGLGLWSIEKNHWLKLACLGSLPVALFCLYLAQMRSMLVMTGVCSVSFIGLMALRGEGARVAGLVLTLVAVVALSLAWAMVVGGEAATKRMLSLVEDKPSEVYYSNRGHFLERTFTQTLPDYPLGAGLGRWGMMYYYFGNKNDPQRNEIWSEIQWTGWIVDGGAPLTLLYLGAMGACFWVAGKAAMDPSNGPLGIIAAMIFAYNAGALAMTFNYPLFIGQSGLEFWILNASLFAVLGGVRWRYIVLPPRLEPNRMLPPKPQGSMKLLTAGRGVAS